MASTNEQQQKALQNAIGGQSLMNYGTIFDGFAEKGVPMADIQPRVNVFTFRAWLAQGRVVRKGEHGVRVCTFISIRRKDAENKDEKGYRKPHTTTVFHISQTDPVDGH